LALHERDRFERHYLTTPDHRRRVAVAGALRTAVPSKSSGRRQFAVRWSLAAGFAAALIIVVAVLVLMLRTRSVPGTVPEENRPFAAAPAAAPPQPSAPPATARVEPVVVTLSISPILVRGANETASLAIAAETDVLRLHLQGQRNERPLGRGRAVVRTVTGDEVWTGSTTGVVGAKPHELARIDIPAARLRPEDYIVELLETDASGREVERYRYFFRVRTP
jgi:hypothetical protein